jgi:hypothetical protein
VRVAHQPFPRECGALYNTLESNKRLDHTVLPERDRGARPLAQALVAAGAPPPRDTAFRRGFVPFRMG